MRSWPACTTWVGSAATSSTRCRSGGSRVTVRRQPVVRRDAHQAPRTARLARSASHLYRQILRPDSAQVWAAFLVERAVPTGRSKACAVVVLGDGIDLL